MESESECCLFQDSQHSICSGSADGLKNISEARLQTINLKSRLLELSPPALKKLKTHDNCISTYTSETHIKIYLRKKEKEHLSSPEVDI